MKEPGETMSEIAVQRVRVRNIARGAHGEAGGSAFVGMSGTIVSRNRASTHVRVKLDDAKVTGEVSFALDEVEVLK